MTSGTVHFVYPHGPRVSCPDAIGREVGRRLKTVYRVRQYDWDEARTIRPATGDVLLGHPHPAPWTVFRRSMRRRGWRRIIAMSPFNHGDTAQIAFLDSVVRACDLYLAITGNYWFDTAAKSAVRHWLPKMRHLDLAVARADFPVVKHQFNPPGARRFVYIGHSGWPKNTEYLSQLALSMPDVRFSWIGRGKAGIPGVARLGIMDFATRAAQEAISANDFLITLGRADANPATIVEAMAWGLIPVCTKESGYTGVPGIVNVPLDDLSGAVRLVRDLQAMPEARLFGMQRYNWERLDHHFNWDRFTAAVIHAIESCESPECSPRDPGVRWALRRAAALSPYAPWRPANVLTWLGPLMRPDSRALTRS